MKNPIEHLSAQTGLRWLSSGWLVIPFLILAAVTGPRTILPGTFIAPHGVALEMTGTADGALGILRALDDEQHLLDAQRAISWDFLFILGYSVGLALLLNWIARHGSRTNQGLIAYAMWGALLAGGCALVKNCAVLILIGRYPDHAYFGLIALLGTVFSLAKWTLFFAAAGYTAVQVIVSAGDLAARAEEALGALIDRLAKPRRRGGAVGETEVEPGGI